MDNKNNKNNKQQGKYSGLSLEKKRKMVKIQKIRDFELTKPVRINLIN